MLDDPWRDRAIAIRFHDETGAVQAIRRSLVDRPASGVLAVGDRPALIAALAAGNVADCQGVLLTPFGSLATSC